MNIELFSKQRKKNPYMWFIDVEWGEHLHKQKSNELFIRSLVKKAKSYWLLFNRNYIQGYDGSNQNGYLDLVFMFRTENLW
jgi:hypothetical protein